MRSIWSSFFFTAPSTTEIYTFPYTTLFRSDRARLWSAPARGRDDYLPALPSSAFADSRGVRLLDDPGRHVPRRGWVRVRGDRKSTRLNSSHGYISYAVFCLKKKNIIALTLA